MNTLLCLLILLFLSLMVKYVIRISSLTLAIRKSPQVRVLPNPKEKEYLLIKGLF